MKKLLLTKALLIISLACYAQTCPTVDAGVPQLACENTQQVNLNATTTNASSILWTTSGTGVFTPSATIEDPNYEPSPDDVAQGSVFLTLTASEVGCPDVSDQIVIYLNPIPVVNAGPDQIVCNNTTTVQLNATAENAVITWTIVDGQGAFTDIEDLNAGYIVDPQDLQNGQVTLSIIGDGAGCPLVSDEITITFAGAATANAGIDQTKCGGAPSTLNPTIGGSTAGSWTTSGSGTFSPDANTLNATYTPSAADVSSGSVTLTLTTSGGSCGTASDQMVITYSSTPLANAGADQTICPEDEVSLTGSVSGATPTWTTSGSGTFSPNANLENVTYIPSAADKTSGTVTLTLTSSGGTCSSVSDEMQLTITNVCVTGINSSQSVDNLIKIYPNPAIEYTEIEISQGIAITDISIYNILGEKVGSSEVLDAVVLINMENLSRGFYYFIFTDKSGSKYTKRIIKQ